MLALEWVIFLLCFLWMKPTNILIFSSVKTHLLMLQPAMLLHMMRKPKRSYRHEHHGVSSVSAAPLVTKQMCSFHSNLLISSLSCESKSTLSERKNFCCRKMLPFPGPFSDAIPQNTQKNKEMETQPVSRFRPTTAERKVHLKPEQN